MLHRLRTDFQLALVTLFGGCAMVGVAPFAVYRFAIGAEVPAAINAAVVLLTWLIVSYAWRSGRTRGSSILLALMYSTVVTTQTLILGVAALFWIFPTLLGNFLLVGRVLAATLSMVAIVIVAWYADVFAEPVERWAFVAGALVTCLLSFIFASRTRAQHQQLELQATHDALTGIPNRRAMEHELAFAAESMRRSGTAFGLILMDLDHFKRVNDRFGHGEGDRVLVSFTRVVARNTRKVDRLFRLGGEEFVLLVSATTPAGLRMTADKLRECVEVELLYPDGVVTVSAGAVMLRAGEHWQDWLRRADAALYRAKNGGRNRVVVDEDESAVEPPQVL
ncbi:MAG TPA: diguanylate cyclase [Xanthomonadaceae bacterium]|nr:diguanylate cyclase [Xanthomonadaceae bacterium]